MSNRNNRKTTGKVARAVARNSARSLPRAVARGVLPHNVGPRHNMHNNRNIGRNVSRRNARRVRQPRGLLLSLLSWLWAGLTVFVLVMYAINTDELNPIVFGVIFFGSMILFVVLTTPLRRRRRARHAQQFQEEFHDVSSFNEEPTVAPSNPAVVAPMAPTVQPQAAAPTSVTCTGCGATKSSAAPCEYCGTN